MIKKRNCNMIATREGAKFWFGMDLPKHVISISRNHPGEDWKYYTTFDVLKKKRDKNEWALKYKRSCEIVKPAYVWVFYNEGWIFGGWYIYIKTLKENYALNFRNNCRNEELHNSIIKKIMNFYPCGILPFDFYVWAEAFEKTFHHEGFKRTKQGLLKCHCKIDEQGNLIDIDQ
jgi:hypothetical protein